MEAEETNHNPKRSRGIIALANGTMTGNNAVSKLEEGDNDDESRKKMTPWQHPSSRIYRVSRASGGKDRHSKVYTAKGIRDRRVRLSVSTAIQFYDLQDRLGYDQPSKAIEWLIKAASTAIDKLPSLDSASFFNATRPEGETDMDPDVAAYNNNSNNNNQLSRSGCSSTSETSKGSVLSLSRSENRVKARERARERAKDKEKNQDETPRVAAQGGSSFTELLTGASGHGSATAGPTNSSGDCIAQKQEGSWHLPTAAVLTTADYLNQSGFYTQNRKSLQNHNHHQIQHGFSAPAYGNFPPMGMVSLNFSQNGNAVGSPTVAVAPGDHQEMQQFSFLQDNSNLIPVAASVGPTTGDYNLNFSISSGLNLVGVNRGPLQSNSPSSQIHHHHHQHQHQHSHHLDGSNLPFYFSTPAGGSAAGATSAENQFIQLWDGYNKEKGKG